MILLMMLAVHAHARQINWRCLSNKNNLTSDQQLMGENFVFELGCFQDGFEPTSENVADWAANWHVVDRTGYRSDDKAFSSGVVIGSNLAPITLGKQAYVWGYRASSGDSEWILATRSSWTWPGPATMAFPLTWVVTDSADVIVGSVNSSSAPVYMETAAVRAPLPVVLPCDWQEAVFSSPETIRESVSFWMADPDDDGLSNMLEYALGLNPVEADDELALDYDGLPSLNRVTLRRFSNRLVDTEIEVSTDLSGWNTPESQGARLLIDRPEVVTIEFTDAHVQGFIRATASWQQGFEP